MLHQPEGLSIRPLPSGAFEVPDWPSIPGPSVHLRLIPTGWPGDTDLIAPLVRRAVDLALQRQKDVDPETDNEQLIEAIQAHLMPDETILIGWIRDPSYGTLSDHDGSSRTGVEMLHTAADWLTWSLARTATEVVQAMRKPS